MPPDRTFLVNGGGRARPRRGSALQGRRLGAAASPLGPPARAGARPRPFRRRRGTRGTDRPCPRRPAGRDVPRLRGYDARRVRGAVVLSASQVCPPARRAGPRRHALRRGVALRARQALLAQGYPADADGHAVHSASMPSQFHARSAHRTCGCGSLHRPVRCPQGRRVRGSRHGRGRTRGSWRRVGHDRRWSCGAPRSRRWPLRLGLRCRFLGFQPQATDQGVAQPRQDPVRSEHHDRGRPRRGLRARLPRGAGHGRAGRQLRERRHPGGGRARRHRLSRRPSATGRHWPEFMARLLAEPGLWDEHEPRRPGARPRRFRPQRR